MPSNAPTSTKNLYVFQNGIETIVQYDFIGLKKLELLDLSQNELTDLPDRVFEPLSSLRNLDLSSNRISHISKDSFAGLELLERLYLCSNTIKSIHPAAFNGLEQLLELKLQGNKLTTLPALKMPRLVLLDLRFNRIPSLGPDDLQTPTLESLMLGGLGMNTVNEELLRSLKNLHELDISNNQLNVLPLGLQEARGLVKLNLAGNSLSPLNWEDLANLKELQELNLSNLSLQSLPESMTQLFPVLKKLTVAENPFNCLCTLAWFPSWLRNQKIVLGRTEETRCHFPPRVAGKLLERLVHQDFGCPTRTNIPVSTVKTTTVANALITTLHSTPNAHHPINPSNDPSTGTDSYQLPIPASPSVSADTHIQTSICPSSICLNGGTCWFNHQGQFACSCPRGTSGTYCENEEDLVPVDNDSIPTIIVEPEITAQTVTSSSILLDLYRYIEARPNIRGVRLTYRNLSGSDKRPKQLNIPTSYPEYTLRGLLSNSTYSICASPVGEPSDVDRVCTEAQTFSPQRLTNPIDEPQLTTALAPAVALLLLVVLVAIAIACYVYRRKTHLNLYCDPSQLELEGVKTGLDNGGLPQKQPEITSLSSIPQNVCLDYEVPLIANNINMNMKLP